MDVYEEIRAERAEQVAKGRTAAEDDRRTHVDWIRCLEKVVAKALWLPKRKMWIKVGSVAVAAVEAIDRRVNDATPCGRCRTSHPIDWACPPDAMGSNAGRSG